MQHEGIRGQPGPSWERTAVIAILGLAALVRWIRWERTEVIFADGPRFLSIAKAAAAGDWAAVLQDDFHPLYPLTVAALHTIVPDWEAAGVGVSILGGVLAVACLYGLVRVAFGFSPAIVAAVIAAVHVRVVEFTSDVQSEGLYLGLFMGAVWASWRGLSERSIRWAAVAGGFAGLAYLTRPEGLGIVAVAGLVVLVEVIRRRWRLRDGIAWGAAFSVVAVLLVSPYLVAMSTQAGELTLTRKKSLSAMMGLSDETSGALRAASPSAPLPALNDPMLPPEFVPPDGLVPSLVELFRKALKTLRYDGTFLLLVGLWLARGRPTLRGRFFLALIGAYGLLLFGLMMSAGYVSRRHWLPVLVPLLGYAALAAPALGQAMLKLLRRPRWPAWAPAALGLILVIGPAVYDMGQMRASRHLAERWAGERAASMSEGDVVVATRRSYAAYYARGRHLPIQPSMDTLEPKKLRDRGATHVILSGDTFDQAHWKMVLARPGVHLVERFEANGREVVLLEVEPARSVEQ